MHSSCKGIELDLKNAADQIKLFCRLYLVADWQIPTFEFQVSHFTDACIWEFLWLAEGYMANLGSKQKILWLKIVLYHILGETESWALKGFVGGVFLEEVSLSLKSEEYILVV